MKCSSGPLQRLNEPLLFLMCKIKTLAEISEILQFCQDAFSLWIKIMKPTIIQYLTRSFNRVISPLLFPIQNLGVLVPIKRGWMMKEWIKQRNSSSLNQKSTDPSDFPNLSFRARKSRWKVFSRPHSILANQVF